jgi:hypothetical protein
MPRLPKRCIESVDYAIEGTELMLDSLKIAKECAKSLDSYGKGHSAGFEKAYEINIEVSMDMLIAIIPWLMLSGANSDHFKKLCDKARELGLVITKKEVG